MNEHADRFRSSPSPASPAAIPRATVSSKSCAASTACCGRGRRWRWSPPRAPANPPCCTSPGLLERPDGGVVAIDGEDASELDDRARTALRRDKIGFVYQFHHLLPEFTALENVMTPQLIAGLTKREARERAHELLDYLGLGARANHRPSELSGGEQQRVAIARAVANAPALLLADEPTGNLDPQTAEKVFSALMTLVRATGLAAVIATHNLDLAARMDRRWTLRNGLLVELE